VKLAAVAITAALAGVASASPGAVVRVAGPDQDALPSHGPRDALVTIELFFQPWTSSRRPEYKLIEKLAAAHPSRVRVIYRLIKASSSSRLHYAGLEAYAEGKFDAFMTELNKQPSPNLTDPQLFQLCKAAGMDPQQLALVIANPPAAFDRVLEDDQRRMRQRVRGVTLPAVLINGQLLRLADIAKPADLERAYTVAKDAALDLLDRGVAPSGLAAAFEAQAAPNPLDISVSVGQLDDGADEVPNEPVLAAPALDLRGMPTLGPADAAVTIAVLCNPTSIHCQSALRAATTAQEVFVDRVRVVWAPFFDVGRDDAADLGLLADAALCAERVGTSIDDFTSPASPGWQWVENVQATAASKHRRVPADQLLVEVSDKLHVDHEAFAACRARQAGAAIRWIERARHAGVRASPSTVIGGRIYPSIAATDELQRLVAAELEPGDCDGCLRLETIAPAGRP
jgi:hypothetical protein